MGEDEIAVLCGRPRIVANSAASRSPPSGPPSVSGSSPSSSSFSHTHSHSHSHSRSPQQDEWEGRLPASSGGGPTYVLPPYDAALQHTTAAPPGPTPEQYATPPTQAQWPPSGAYAAYHPAEGQVNFNLDDTWSNFMQNYGSL